MPMITQPPTGQIRLSLRSTDIVVVSGPGVAVAGQFRIQVWENSGAKFVGTIAKRRPSEVKNQGITAAEWDAWPMAERPFDTAEECYEDAEKTCANLVVSDPRNRR